MGKQLDRLNQRWDEKVERYKEAHQTEDPLRTYERYLAEGKVFTAAFAGCDKDGTFSSLVEGGIMMVLNKESLHEVPAFRANWVRHMVGFEFDVMVDSISEDKRTVYVKPVRKSRPLKEQLEGEIIRELNDGNMPIVWGQITSVKPDTATVDILGQHIMGVVKAANWSNSYVRNLTDHVTAGEVHKFQVHAAAKKRQGKPRAFWLDRKPFTGDPWKEIPMDYVHEGAIILVKCIDRPEEKSYWWGTCNLIPNIEIQGDFTKRVDVVRGLSYKCRVKKIDIPDNHKDRKFKVIPLSISDQDKDVYHKYLAEKKKAEKAALDAQETGITQIGE